MNFLLILKAIIFIILLIFLGSYVEIKADSANKPALSKNGTQTNTSNKTKSTSSVNSQINASITTSGSPTILPPKQVFKVKGIHITSWVAGTKKQFEKIIELIRETELNTVVIDIKEVDGIIGYEADVPLAREIKATQKRIRNIDEILFLCDKYGIYKIARITGF